ncbi:MAG TPA: alcohol dehydrogenase catalytic domain-containing protein [Caldilineaceae bacterium]|nr:alcohol dehydrogenase catalytic domain-containing protein [Caldilineaceae bacterium]
MRALLLTDQGPCLHPAYPDPHPQPGEALVRVRLTGICATDLALLAGYKGGYRGVLGHEFVGEVTAAPGQEEWVGCRVVGEINIGCGDCSLCRRGLHKHCRQRQSLGILRRDGALADFLTLPVANLHRVPDSVSDDQAVFVEPLAAALQLLEQVHVTPTQRVIVVGDGRLGQLIAQVMTLTGCQLTVLGRHEAKLKLLGGTGASLLLSEPAVVEALAAEPADLVVEATGSPQGFATARRLVRPGGLLALKSTFAGNVAEFDLSSLVVDEITLLGSRCGPFEPALRLLAAGRVQVAHLIQARFPLDQAVEALAFAGRRGVLKVVVAP